jgi:hypothetical protein
MMENTEHYHREQIHRGIGNRPIDPHEVGLGEIQRHERLGGLLGYYCRSAA